MVRIVLCLIVRDEEERLARCLEAARPAVDEVVICDTGSRDGTLAVAREHGARVVSLPWKDDFSAARNAALALASGPAADAPGRAETGWALVLDADELLLRAADAGVALRAFAERASGDPTAPRAGRVRLVNDLGPDQPPSTIELTRFFPLDARWRYAGRIHEQVLCDGRTPARGDTGVEVSHSGYAPDELRRRDKLARNERLLRRELEEAPQDAYLRYQLGRTLQTAERCREALTQYERALAVTSPATAPYYAHLAESAATCLRAEERAAEGLALLEPALAAWPERADALFLASLLELDLGRIEVAERGFRRCLDLAGVLPGGGESSAAASGSAPACNLGVICEVLGRTPEAREWYARALAADPGHEPSRAGLARLGVPVGSRA